MRFLLTLAFCLPLLAALAFPASAATLHGTIYGPDLAVATEVLVTIDTRPMQRILSLDGNYSFDVPQGNYTISLFSAKTNISTTEQVSVVQDGSFAFDIFLLPGLEEDERLYQDISADFAQTPANPQPDMGPGPLLAAVFVAALVAIIAFLTWPSLRDGKCSAFGEGRDHVPESIDAVLAILKKEGGRMTQKELRKRLPYGEAKVSLLVAELEAKGKVEKLRKGRGNILVLK